MKEIKEKILTLVQTSKKGTLDRRAIEKALDMKTSGDFVRLGKILDEMESGFDLIRNRENRYLTQKQAQMFTGKLSVNRKGIGYVDREDDESILIGPEFQKDALDGDMVLVCVFAGSDDGEVISTIEHSRTELIGTYIRKARGLIVQLDDEKLRGKEIRVRTTKNFTPIEGLKVQLHIEKYGNPLILCVSDVIGHKDDPGVDISAILLDNGIELEFPEEVIQEANGVSQTIDPSQLENRRDLREELTITIDGDDSKDFDDAVSVVSIPEGWLLKVSIADVSHYVKAGTFLDQEAFKRGNSTYVVDRVVPMLPHILSNGICSLNPQEDRFAVTCEMMIGRDGSTLSYEVYPSVICSKERMTYQNVNRILRGNEAVCQMYAHLIDMLTCLRDCADAIRLYRHKKGAIDFDTTETSIKVDEYGKPIRVFATERGHAEEIIEDCMIAANVAVANFMKKHEIPAVYRIHEEPQAKRMREFVETSILLGKKFSAKHSHVKPLEVQEYLESAKSLPQYPVLSKFLLRCMQKAKYDAACVGHFGLAEEEYLHFTSPIRRYSDLVVHRMLRKYFFEKCNQENELAKDQKFMVEASEQTSICERNSVTAERAVTDMKVAEYMMNQIGEKAEGIITSVTNFGFYVQLPNTVEGLVRIASLNDDYYHFDASRGVLIGDKKKRQFSIGQKVMIEVVSADKDSHTVEFALAKPKKYAKNRNESEKRSHKDFRGKREFGNHRSEKNRSSESKSRDALKRKKDHRSSKNRSNTSGRKGKNSWAKQNPKKK